MKYLRSIRDCPVGSVAIRRWSRKLGGDVIELSRAVILRTSENETFCLYSDLDQMHPRPVNIDDRLDITRTHELVPEEVIPAFDMLRRMGRHSAALRLIGVEPRGLHLTENN